MKKYTKLICMIAAVCLLGAAAFCGFRTYANSYGTISERIIQPLKVSHTSATMLPATMLIIGNSIIHRHKLKRRVLTICGQLRLLNFTPGTFMRNGPS